MLHPSHLPRLPLLFFLLLVVACGPQADQPKIGPRASVFPTPYDYTKLEGSFVGITDSSILHITLRKVTGRNAIGQAVKKGVRRNIAGVMELVNSKFHFVLREPGNSPADGVFDILVDTITFEMTGKWLPRVPGNQPEFSFKLARENYEYETPHSFGDSLHYVYFSNDGQCTYQFYNRDSNGVEDRQMTRVTGYWTLANDCFSVKWDAGNSFIPVENKICIDSLENSNISGERYFFKVVRLNGRILSSSEF